MNSALKNGALDEQKEKLLYRVMSDLNRVAGEEMTEFGANACTDITGFGFLGHLLEMMEESSTKAIINSSSLPLLPDVLSFVEKGFLTGGGLENYKFASKDVEIDGEVSRELVMVLYDPQTSGGLLVSIPEEMAEDYMESILKRGVDEARIVGRVVEESEKRIIVKG